MKTIAKMSSAKMFALSLNRCVINNNKTQTANTLWTQTAQMVLYYRSMSSNDVTLYYITFVDSGEALYGMKTYTIK